MKPLAVVLTCSLFATSVFARADFTYQESAQITGGSVVSMMKLAGAFSKSARQAGDPILTSVMVKGNRMIRNSKGHSEIIDLDTGTVTEVDHLKKQYTTMTFEQMRQQMEASVAKAKAEQAKQSKQQQQPAPDAQKVDVQFKIKVRNTGVSKEVAGLTARESILTMNADATEQKSGQTGSLAMTNDMYLAPDIPGYEEVREFEKRYALKLGMVLSPAITPQMMGMMQQPAAGKGMADMVEEMSKLKGIPVLQIMRMGTTVDGSPLPAASEAPLPAGPPTPTAGEIAKQSASAAIMSSLPFGGFGRKKKQEEPPPSSDSAQPSSAVLIEMSTQMTNFSRSSIDPAEFRPPAGYKQVEPRQID
jgi:hypothetical protein